MGRSLSKKNSNGVSYNFLENLKNPYYCNKWWFTLALDQPWYKNNWKNTTQAIWWRGVAYLNFSLKILKRDLVKITLHSIIEKYFSILPSFSPFEPPFSLHHYFSASFSISSIFSQKKNYIVLISNTKKCYKNQSQLLRFSNKIWHRIACYNTRESSH